MNWFGGRWGRIGDQLVHFSQKFKFASCWQTVGELDFLAQIYCPYLFLGSKLLKSSASDAVK